MPLFMFFSSLFIKLYGFHGSFTATIIQHPQKVARFCHQVPNRCLFCAWKHGSAWNHQFSLLCNLHCHKYSWLGDLVSPIKPYKNHCLSFEGEVIMCPNVQWYGHASIPIRKSHIAASTRSIHVSETSCDDPTKYNFWWCSISNSWYGLMHIYIYMQKKHNIT